MHSKQTHKRNKNRWPARLVLLISVSLLYCTKPTDLGGDLVEQEQANIKLVDSLLPQMTTHIAKDSFLTYLYSPAFPFISPRHYAGIFEDPFFGTDTAEIIAVFTPGQVNYHDLNLEGAVVDSVFLNVMLDSAGVYGDPQSMHTIEVYRLAQAMEKDTSYYSNNYLPTEPSPIGQKTDFVPDLNKRILKISLDSSIVDSNAVYFRIPLDNSFGQEILDLDSADFADLDQFAAKFKGIKIKGASASGSLIGVNIRHQLSEIDIYYHSPTEDSLLLRLSPLGGYPVAQYFTHQFEGYPVNAHIDVPDDSLLFVESNKGLEVEIKLPDLSVLGENIIINKAILELVVEELPGDDTLLYRPVNRYFLTDTSGTFIKDVQYIQESGPGDAVFGGFLKQVLRDGQMRTVVQMNISAFLQDVQSGMADNTITLIPASNSLKGRTVFKGFSSSGLARPKLYIKFTEVK